MTQMLQNKVADPDLSGPSSDSVTHAGNQEHEESSEPSADAPGVTMGPPPETPVLGYKYHQVESAFNTTLQRVGILPMTPGLTLGCAPVRGPAAESSCPASGQCRKAYR